MKNHLVEVLPLNCYIPYSFICIVLLLVMGKAEGSVQQEEWHGHVTAVTVAPEYRRLGLAARLMSNLEEISEKYIKIIIASE